MEIPVEKGVSKRMERQWKFYSLAFSVALGLTPTAMGQGGVYTAIDFPESTQTLAWAINKAGGIGMISGIVHGFLLSDGEYTIFDVPGSTYTNSTALTAHGEIIGRYVAANGTGYGYLLKDGLFRTIAFPGASFTGSASMNERGDIVGRYQNDGSTAFHGFLLRGLTSATPRVAVTTSGPAVTHASDYKLVTAANPGAPGEVLSLFASGLGATQPEVGPGEPFSSRP